MSRRARASPRAADHRGPEQRLWRSTLQFGRACLLACNCAISLLACAVWSAFDRKRADYRKLNGWLLIGVRYYLTGMMMFYGFLKVIKNQRISSPIRAARA